LDLNDKNDYSDVLFFATEIIGTAKKTGWDNWCKSYRDKAAPLFETAMTIAMRRPEKITIGETAPTKPRRFV
jgi:hypothetical protein